MKSTVMMIFCGAYFDGEGRIVGRVLILVGFGSIKNTLKQYYVVTAVLGLILGWGKGEKGAGGGVVFRMVFKLQSTATVFKFSISI